MSEGIFDRISAGMIFIANAAIAAGYAILFLVATKPLLAVYGIAPTREAVYMARSFGLSDAPVTAFVRLAISCSATRMGWMMRQLLAMSA